MTAHTDVIAARCGHYNVDVLAGWKAGIGPRRRIGGTLFDHHPPEHLTGKRYSDWLLGYTEAQRYRASAPRKRVCFTGTDPDGKTVVIWRTGWNVRRGPVITRLERAGCTRDVTVDYLDESGQIVRTRYVGI
jgi:hypothetical protein